MEAKNNTCDINNIINNNDIKSHGIGCYDELIKDKLIQFSGDSDEDSDETLIDSDEWTDYYNHGTQKDGSMNVAGGGMADGFTHANVIKIDGRYWYYKYHSNPANNYREDIGNKIIWADPKAVRDRNDGMGAFNVIDTWYGW